MSKDTTVSTTKKAEPKTILGFAWDAIAGIITLNRNDVKVIKSDLAELNEQVVTAGLEPMELETYINNKFNRLLPGKYNGYKLGGESAGIRNVTESIQAVHDSVEKAVRDCDDCVIVDGQPYLPDSKGNYKKPVLTFTVRANKNLGMTKDEVQSFINEEVAKVLNATDSELENTSDEVINQ